VNFWITITIAFLFFSLNKSCTQELAPSPPQTKAATPDPLADQSEAEDSKPNNADIEDRASSPVDSNQPLTPVTLFRAFDDTYGCKGPYPEPWTCENVSINGQEQGSFLTIARPDARYLLAAPHGWFDAGTDTIAASIFPSTMAGQSSVWSTMIAHSFRGNAPSGLSHNVNRPSLLNNDSCQDLPALNTSKMVYDRYKGHMDRLISQAALYFEIHGQSEPGLESIIEVATARVTAAEAEAIKRIMTEELAKAAIEGIEIRIEPVEEVFFNAGLTKQCGAINHIGSAPSVHTENPRQMREGEEAQLKTAIFYRGVLLRLASEIFPTSRPVLNSPSLGLIESDFQPMKFGSRH